MAPRVPGKKLETGRAAILEQQVFIDLTKTQEEKMAQLSTLLKQSGLSEPQYNVLRILRGAGNGGLACQQIAERMLTRLPDITRLVDRLVENNHVDRERGALGDRRRVMIRIKHKGLSLLSKLDEPVAKLHRKQFSNLSQADLRELKRLLIQARSSE